MYSRTLCRACRSTSRIQTNVPFKQTTHLFRNHSLQPHRFASNGRSGLQPAQQPWIDYLLTPIRAYGRLQQRRPYITQVSTMVTVLFTGDLSAQCIGSQMFSSREYEPSRGIRSAVIGAIWSIPAYHWFMWLSRSFQYASWIRTIGTKILIQQSLFVPVVNTYFFGMQSLLAGSGLDEAKERVKKAVPISWKNSWKLWPMVTAISFTYVPPQYRSVFGSLFATVWQTYLSWVNQRAESDEVSTVGRRSQVVA